MNATSDALLFNQSLAAMLDKAFMAKVYLPMAPIGLLANVLIILTIWRTKAIHNKSHYIILSYTIADALYELCMIIWEIRLVIRVQQRSPMVLPSWLCVLNYQQIGIAAQTAAILSAALALDRFMCVATPIFYKQLDQRRYILVVNAVAYSYTIVIVLIGVIGTDLYRMWNCENASYQYNIVGQTQYDKISTISAGVMGVLYVSAAAILIYRYKKAGLTGASQKAEWKQRWELQVFISMSVVGVVAVVMRGGQGILFTIAQEAKGTNIGIPGEVLVTMNVVTRFAEAVLHFIIYFAIDGGFRTGFKKIVFEKVLRRNMVTPIESADGVSTRVKRTEA